MKYETGKKYKESIRHEECTEFSFGKNGLDLKLYSCNPKEIKINQSHPIEIRDVQISKVLFFLFRFEESDWVTIPYHPCYDNQKSIPILIDDTLGLVVNIYIFQCDTGKLMQQRHSVIPNRMSRGILDSMLELLSEGISVEEYIEEIDGIMEIETEESIALMAHLFKDSVCRI